MKLSLGKTILVDSDPTEGNDMKLHIVINTTTHGNLEYQLRVASVGTTGQQADECKHGTPSP